MSTLVRDDAGGKAERVTDLMQVIAELTNECFFAARTGQEPSIGGQGIKGTKELEASDEFTHKGIHGDHTFCFEFAERHVNSPLIRAGGAQAVEGQIGTLRLDQLRREPHILGWMSRLRSQSPPLATASCINLLIPLRCIFNELTWTEQLSELAHLIRREDIPRLPRRLPRPLTTEQDELLQQEFRLRNDLGSNVFLLIRHTGMRIGECADLSFDGLRSTGPGQWAIHVPLGKLKTERMVPVDPFVCELAQRLRSFRSLDPLPQDSFLLARPHRKEALVRQLRDYLHQVCHALGLSPGMVPHSV